MKKLIIPLVVLLVLVLIGAGLAKWGISKYNGLVVLGQGVDKQWGQVENVLQRRNDLIPNLVNVVQAYAVQEQEVFIKVAEARSMWMKATQGGTVADKMKADQAVSAALINLMAVVEKYPDLKSNQNFLALQDELAGTENRIAVERMRYNEEVQSYNTAAKQFPTNFVVKFFNFPAERDYFKADAGAQKAPEVKFTYPGVPVPGVPPSGQQPIQAAPTTPQAIPAPTITPPTTVPTPTPVPTPAPAASAPAPVPPPAAVQMVAPEPPSAIKPSPQGASGTLQPISPSQIAPQVQEAPPARPVTPVPVTPQVPPTPVAPPTQ